MDFSNKREVQAIEVRPKKADEKFILPRVPNGAYKLQPTGSMWATCIRQYKVIGIAVITNEFTILR
jgi:hypothetical protein